jgi:hypothetical protein
MPFLPEKLFEDPTFHHGPPPSVHGCRRWPPAPDFQSSPVFSSLTIGDIYVHISISPFLDAPSCCSIRCTLASLWYGVLGTPLWYYRPWSPYRRRLWGFGTPTLDRSALLIMRNPTKLRSSLPHGHFLTLRHEPHASMFARAGAHTSSFELMLATSCPWPIYKPIAQSSVPCHPQR